MSAYLCSTFACVFVCVCVFVCFSSLSPPTIIYFPEFPFLFFSPLFPSLFPAPHLFFLLLCLFSLLSFLSSSLSHPPLISFFYSSLSPLLSLSSPLSYPVLSSPV